MSERTRRSRLNRRVVAVIALLALCAVTADALGLVEPIVTNAHWNTSPPLTATVDGVTLSAAHSRYLTIDAITLTLTNQSLVSIYLPVMSQEATREGGYVPVENVPTSYECSPIETEVQDAQGWRSLGSGCYSEWQCPGGMASRLPGPAVLAIKPGQTAVFPLYDGQSTYPLWSPGAYRFRILFSQTPFQAAQSFSLTQQAMPHAVVLMSGLVSLTSAWWIPPWYHQTPPHCPIAA